MAPPAATTTPTPVPSVRLSDGSTLPLVGYGTSSVVGKAAIKTALEAGYRFIDSAALYGNEEIVGEALRDSIESGLVRRHELCVCTKLWNTRHKRASVVAACKESLGKLKLDCIDLYLIHWPVAYVEDGNHPINPTDPNTGKLVYSDTHYTETWRGMEDCKELGLVRSIGLSNFNHNMIDEILSMPNLRHRPTVNQVECHPYLSQARLLDYSKQNNIVLNAYCPLGSPNSCASPDQPALLDEPLIVELARAHNKSPAQIAIRFQLQRNVSAIPKSCRAERIRENLSVLDFELSQSEMDQLLALNRDLRYCLNTAGHFVDDHPLYPFHSDF